MTAKKKALISVSDKTGVVDFAKNLVLHGYEIISTGGTAGKLKENQIPVTYISDITGFPEILGGRVKTLHPKVHGGLLAKNTKEHLDELKENDIELFDLVAVNLYPFKQTISKPDVSLEEAIENIDIGGPTLIRASAKNFGRITVIVNPERYKEVINEINGNGIVSKDTRFDLALEAFNHTAEYDSVISDYLSNVSGSNEFSPQKFSVAGEKIQDLRYGENPHQKAAFYKDDTAGPGTVAGAFQRQGKELSFNNIVDIEAAFSAVKDFEKPAVVIIKHTNPCGVAVQDDLKEAYDRALSADPVSAFGGIVGLNREVGPDTASALVDIFLEAVIAPRFTEEALEILSSKPNLRVLEAGDYSASKGLNFDLKKVSGGFLVQEEDSGKVLPEDWEVVTEREPEGNEIDELLFAWTVVKHVKSNAIVLAKDFMTLGVGAGQMNRVGSAKIAFEQAGEKSAGSFLASDAFFPFGDTVDEAAKHGVKAIIQPGGSKRDDESIKAADENGIAMVFTGMRHFKH